MNRRNPLLVVALATAASLLPAQESQALFDAPMAVLGADSPPFQKLADFDGDGDLDAVGTRVHGNGNGNQIVVWRNDQGTMNVAWQGSATQGTGPGQIERSFAIDVADLNGDGLMDFFVATEGTIERFHAQPGMQFTSQVWWLVGASPGRRAVVSGDFDADGLVDVAALTASSGTDRLYVFFGNGNWASQVLPFSASHLVRLHAGDLDGVAGDELLVSARNLHTAQVWTFPAGQLHQHLALTSAMTTLSPGVWLWVIGDVDGDQDNDLVVFKHELDPSLSSRYQIFRQVAPGQLSAEPTAIGGPAEYLADIDGDGDLDGVCCGGGGPSFQWPELDFASTFELATNRGGGDFAPAFRFPGAGSESLAGAADLDGDGDLELVAGRCVYYGNGPWLEQPMPTAGGPDALATLRIADLEDVDRDGDPDFGPMVNRGDGAFEPEAAEPAPPTGYSYQFSAIRCDVDGDGVRDRIRYLNQDGVGFAGMVWLRNNGGGHLTYEGPVAAPTTWIANNSVDEILARDLDGDGDDDLFVQGLAFIWWNQGGYFPGPGQQPIGNVILQGVGDLDLDGIPDLVVTAGDTVKVLAGTGQPSAPFVQVWSHTSPYLLLHEPCLVLLEDLNGDGRLDFVRRWWDGRLRLFVNETAAAATPWLSAPITLPGDEIEIPLSGQSRPTLTAGDIDGDGGVDLIACRLKDGPNLGCVLRRQTTDPLNHGYDVQHFVLGNGFLVDADGDGDLDVVGERTVRNRRFDRVGGGRRVQRHDGVSGESGAAPVLGGTGPYIAGGSHTIHLTGVPGPAVALIGLSIGDAYLVDNPLPGLTLYLDPSWMLVGTMPITENGHGRAAAMASVTLPIFPGTAGWTFHLQAFVPDPVAPPQYTQSNLLSLRIRN